MHALRRAALAAPRQSPLRAAPRASSWQPVARFFSSENLAPAEQTPSQEQKPKEGEKKTEEKVKPASSYSAAKSTATSSANKTSSTSNGSSSKSGDLTPDQQARMDKAIGKSLSYYKKTTAFQNRPPKTIPVATMSTSASAAAPNNTNNTTTTTTAKTPEPQEEPATPRETKDDITNELYSDRRQMHPWDSTQIQRVDWSSEYYGASAYPVSENQYQQLTEPLKSGDVEVKPDGVIYLPEIKYRRKLNQVFGPMGWALIPRGDPVVGQSIVTREYVLVADNRFVSQAQGENNYFNADQLPSAVEGCKSNALMRCCKDLGIASELWDPIFVRNFRKQHMVEAWVEHAVTKKKRTLWFKKGAVEYVYPWKKAAGAAS